MAYKKVSTRLQNKHDLEVNWITAGENGFVPLAGELIIYDKEVDKDGKVLALPDDRDIAYNFERFKIGDGVNNVTDLPFFKDGRLDNLIPTFIGTTDQYNKQKNIIPNGAIVILVDDETDSPLSDATSSILGTGILGYMILG